MSSLDLAGDVIPSVPLSGPSQPEPRWDVAGSSTVGAAVTEPVTGGGWCKGWTCVRRDRISILLLLILRWTYGTYLHYVRTYTMNVPTL